MDEDCRRNHEVLTGRSARWLAHNRRGSFLGVSRRQVVTETAYAMV
jgi:hypothetical protein